SRKVLSIGVFEDSLYWIDSSLWSIFSCHKVTGDKCQLIVLENMSNSLKALSVYHPSMHQTLGDNRCLSANHYCSHFCLMTESSKTRFRCHCPDHMTLDEDNRSCVHRLNPVWNEANNHATSAPVKPVLEANPTKLPKQTIIEEITYYFVFL